MTPEQARTLAQFINDHDPRFRARVEAHGGDNPHGSAAVQCYQRVENGGSGEDLARHSTVEEYVAAARRDSPDPAATFTVKLNEWLADRDPEDRDE